MVVLGLLQEEAGAHFDLLLEEAMVHFVVGLIINFPLKLSGHAIISPRSIIGASSIIFPTHFVPILLTFISLNHSKY